MQFFQESLEAGQDTCDRFSSRVLEPRQRHVRERGTISAHQMCLDGQRSVLFGAPLLGGSNNDYEHLLTSATL
jgi:hypothetical protein